MSQEEEQREERWHAEVVEDVEWGDVDRNQHVNNVALFRKFQEVRVLLTRTFREDLPANLIVVVVRVVMDYRHEVHYGSRVTYRGAFVKFSKSSFVVIFEAEQNGRVAVKGEAVMCVVGDGGKSVPLNSPLLSMAMLTLQQRLATKETYQHTVSVSSLPPSTMHHSKL